MIFSRERLSTNGLRAHTGDDDGVDIVLREYNKENDVFIEINEIICYYSLKSQMTKKQQKTGL